MATDEKKDRAINGREQLRSKAFWIAFEMIFIFGVPAAAAVILSEWLIAREVVPAWGLYVGLATAFVISWVFVILRVTKLSANFRKIEEDISDGETTT